MGIPHSGCRERGKEPGMENAADFIFAAKIRPEPPVGPAFREDLIKKHVFLDADIGAHENQPVTFFISDRDMKVADEERNRPYIMDPGIGFFHVPGFFRSA